MNKRKKYEADELIGTLKQDQVPNAGLYLNVDVNQLLTDRTEAEVYQFLANLKDLLRG